MQVAGVEEREEGPTEPLPLAVRTEDLEAMVLTVRVAVSLVLQQGAMLLSAKVEVVPVLPVQPLLAAAEDRPHQPPHGLILQQVLLQGLGEAPEALATVETGGGRVVMEVVVRALREHRVPVAKE